MRSCVRLPVVSAMAVGMMLAVLVAVPIVAQEPAAPAALDAQVVPAPLTGVIKVALGSEHGCALMEGGTVRCWGNNADGQVDTTTLPVVMTPVPVAGLTNVVDIAAGFAHTCALVSGSPTGGTVFCWGDNTHGQLGSDAAGGQPAPVPGLTGVRAIAAGASHTCAMVGGTVLTGSSVRCWGRNNVGQVGNGNTTSPQPSPVAVVGLGGVTGLSAGGSHTCAVQGTVAGSGAIQCWGSNGNDQLGNPAASLQQTTPLAVSGLTGALAVAAGGTHTCALLANQVVKCWGNNANLQVGDGSNSQRDTPVFTLFNASGAIRISAGALHSCAATADGAALCWGANSSGQQGDGTTEDNGRPTAVPGLAVGVKAVAAGGFHTCAIVGDARALFCWGSNSFGQLGNGTTSNRAVPTPVQIPQTCFALIAVHSGAGSLPIADPANSNTCPDGHYLPNALVRLLAFPGGGQRVKQWAGVTSGAAGQREALRLMPAADITVTVTYEPCRALTRTHTGSGSDPQASLPASSGCANGSYAAGEALTLAAVPGPNQRVKSWSGTTSAPAVGLEVNLLSMPNAAHTVSVTYEPCHVLATSFAGQGEPLVVAPAASQGCVQALQFAAGEMVTLVAQPAPGWAVAGWEGTADDASTQTVNTVAMGNSARSVRVVYTEQPATPAALPVYLPTVQR